MANENGLGGKGGLGGKDVGKFVMYMVIIAACLAVLIYILLNAHPTIAPAVKDTGGKSHIQWLMPMAAGAQAALSA